MDIIDSLTKISKQTFQDTPCHLCGNDSYDIIFDLSGTEDQRRLKEFYKITDETASAGAKFVSCRHCGLIYMNPRPDAATVLNRYLTMNGEEIFRDEAGRRATARYILKSINQEYEKKGRLLDIGCSAGFLLDEAQHDGWQATGVEISRQAVDCARKNFNLKDVHLGTLESARFSPHSFDVIILTDVIEHLIEPRKTLEQCRILLKPDGILCINTPNIGNVVRSILKHRWWGIKESHLYFFSGKTLNELLTAAGFTVTKTRAHNRRFSLGYLASNLARYKPEFSGISGFIGKHPGLSSLPLSINLANHIEVYARRARQIKYLAELETTYEQTGKRTAQKVVAVLPAYRAARTLEKTLSDIPRAYVDDIILVDDASPDDTVEAARKLGIKVFVHEENKGYGANQKTCYREALKMGADIVVMVHPDYQYDPTAIPDMIEPIKAGRADAVFGSRMMKGGALKGGMPLWKYNANILLTALENVTLGIYLTEYHTGFRAYSRKYLTSVNYEKNSDGFVFDTEIIVQGVLKFMRFEEVPIRTRYFDEASSIRLWPSIVYGLSILGTLLKFLIHKAGWRLEQFK